MAENNANEKQSAEQNGPKRRVWVVDDEESVARFVGALVEIKGYEARLFNDPADVIAALADDPTAVDLIITDQTMPGMTGVELGGEIWNVRPDLPVIICSGFSEELTMDTAKEMGFKGYLQKPLDTSMLLGLMGELLSGADE